jgi:hypothetical protein
MAAVVASAIEDALTERGIGVERMPLVAWYRLPAVSELVP